MIINFEETNSCSDSVIFDIKNQNKIERCNDNTIETISLFDDKNDDVLKEDVFEMHVVPPKENFHLSVETEDDNDNEDEFVYLITIRSSEEIKAAILSDKELDFLRNKSDKKIEDLTEDEVNLFPPEERYTEEFSKLHKFMFKWEEHNLDSDLNIFINNETDKAAKVLIDYDRVSSDCFEHVFYGDYDAEEYYDDHEEYENKEEQEYSSYTNQLIKRASKSSLKD